MWQHLDLRPRRETGRGLFVGACITQQGVANMTESKLDAPKASEAKTVPDERMGASAGRINQKSDKPVTEPKFEPNLESKDDHVAHIAELARSMLETKPGVETFAMQILHHVGAIQNPESYNEAVAAKQKAAFEADALSAKQRGRVKVG
jgi:hypothetical protein